MMFEFSSHFANHIKGLIDLKCAMGYKYDESIRILRNFDKFCAINFSNEATLTKEIVFSWCQIKDTENNASFKNRIMPIRELAKYLNGLGVEAYFAPTFGHSRTRPTPYIFSHEELAKLFSALDNIRFWHVTPLQHLISPGQFLAPWGVDLITMTISNRLVIPRGLPRGYSLYPLICRIMYCCGLRPVEARRLKITDVNLETGRLFIAESKSHKDRIVMMPDDLLELCRAYHKKLIAHIPDAIYFFHAKRRKGGVFSKTWLEMKFREVRVAAGIKTVAPRPYDLRHTFATHKLYEWMKAGEDLSVCLPYLSAYMGHVNFSDTAYYIHLVPESLAETLGENLKKLSALLPEVDYEV